MRLRIDNLSFLYKNSRQLFKNISCTLQDGDVLNILGVNGAGKTTFSKCLLNVITQYTGSISFDDINSKQLSIKKRSKYIGYIGLGTEIPLQLSVFEYVMLGSASTLQFFENPSKKHEDSVWSSLIQMNILHLKDKRMWQLSQGERQLVSVARILVQNPTTIIFDEPTASLDLGNQKRMLDLIRNLKNDNHIVINITHNPNQVFFLGGYVLLLLSEGHLFGTVEEIMNEQNLSNLYGTRIRIIDDCKVGNIAVSY